MYQYFLNLAKAPWSSEAVLNSLPFNLELGIFAAFGRHRGCSAMRALASTDARQPADFQTPAYSTSRLQIATARVVYLPRFLNCRSCL